MSARARAYTRPWVSRWLTHGVGSVTTQPTMTPGAFAAKWRGVTTTEKAAGGDGLADVWKKDFFGWEYATRVAAQRAPSPLSSP